MPTISITVPDEIYEEFSSLAEQLKQSPQECAMLALNHFMQTDTIENAIEGVARMQDTTEELIPFPELKEELGLDVKFHPMAMDELEGLEEEDQIEVLESLIHRMANEEELDDDAIDLLLKETPEGQVKISVFPFGDITYLVGPTIVVYHIALAEMDEDFEGDEEE
jgi:predicted transcriptional regulator